MGNERLPPGWAWTELGSIIEEAQPGFACGKRDEWGYVQLRMNNIGRDGKVVTDRVLRIPRNLTNLPKYELRRGDIIFNNTNSAELVGKTILFEGELKDCVYSNHLTRLRVHEGVVTPEWLTWRLIFEQLSGTFERICHRFVGQASVSRTDLLKLSIMLPPYDEQARTATKIVELTNELDSSRRSLQRVPVLMQRFRQSILAKAFRGELTSRAHNDTSVEMLLSRDVTKMPTSPIADAAPLPTGWIWAHVKDIGEVRLGKQRSPSNRAGKFARKYVRVANVFRDRIGLTDIKEMDFPHDDFERYRLQSGDVLLCEGQSPELVGRCAVWNDEIPNCCFQNTLIRVRAPKVLPRYLLHIFSYAADKGDFAQLATQGVNIAHLGATRLADYEIPLAPLEEQARIVKAIEGFFAYSITVEESSKSVMASTRVIEQSALAKAFRGELVLQDPSDEPASVLLEHVRSGQTELVQKKPRR